MKKLITLFALVALFLVGCSAPAFLSAEQTSAPAPTAEPQAPQQTGIAPKHSTSDIIKAFQDAGLTITTVEVYTAETDPDGLLGRDGQYVDKAGWADSNVEGSDGRLDAGTIEAFESEQAAKTRQEYVDAVAKEMPVIETYNYVSGQYCMRLSTGYTKAQAKAFEDIFLAMTK